jgi:hypothetical protein
MLFQHGNAWPHTGAAMSSIMAHHLDSKRIVHWEHIAWTVEYTGKV